MSLPSLRNAGFSCVVVAFAVACGGTVFSQNDDDGGGGSANTGASSSPGGSTSTSGKPTKAGSSATGGSVGAGGSVGKAGSSSTGGSVSVGGAVNCDAVDCAFPVCADGQTPITIAGTCCPTCPPPQLGCSNVMCKSVAAGCSAGYVVGQPAGACCQGCVPGPMGVMCPKIACSESTCPLGYVRGDLVGGCCTECVPDALFCNDDSECVVADRPRPCCGCPEAISVREYDADQCWSDVVKPRPVPKSCEPQFFCDAICAACAPPLSPVCRSHRCVQTALGLK